MQFEELVRDLKSQHKRIFITEAGDKAFIFRLLGRKEYREIMYYTRGDKLKFEEEVCRTAVLFPECSDWELMGAGWAGVLSPMIVEASGLGTKDGRYGIYQMHKAHMDGFEAQAEATIKAAFPHIDFDEMAEWSVDELMFNLTRAEWILREIHGKKISFEREPQPGQEEGQEAPPEPTKKELATKVRQEGIDPMVYYKSTIRFRDPYVQPPLIGGTQVWKNEVTLDATRQQVQRISELKQTVSTIPG